MTLNELKEAIRLKTLAYEKAKERDVAHEELVKIYKELKELQYLKVQLELTPKPESL